GSTFSVILPFALQGAMPRAPSTPAVAAVGQGRSLRILLVEDNLDNQLLAERILTNAGHSVTTAGDGNEALKRLGDGFDLVIMDIQMPRLNGIETTRRIRAGKERVDPDLPIVGVTAHNREVLRKHCLEAGMDDFFSKPYRAGDLLSMAGQVDAMRAARVAQRHALAKALKPINGSENNAS
ncbi:MAG: response regulator, partial [Magnetococcales bacterium]|nr:response regulator [Magnetococcales bacterium]